MIVGTFMDTYLIHLWVIKSYILDFKEEKDVGGEDLLYFCIEDR